MTRDPFSALLIEESSPKTFTRQIVQRAIDDLPPGDVLIRVQFSSLNYKDALSSVGNRGVTRKYPHTPGIDASGVVAHSDSEQFKAGDQVLVTGYDLGMNTSGGLGQYIRVPAGWVVPLPGGLTLREAMIYGTAGFTAGLMIRALQYQQVVPDHGEILVTGATGGVGSIAVAILAHLGYAVCASTGKLAESDFLKMLGATTIIDRRELVDESSRPLLSERWAGVIDVVGGSTLATALKAAKRHGAVICSGLVGSPELHTSVFPFILRGVCLQGVDSAETTMGPRREVWGKLAGDWKIRQLSALATECALNQVETHLQRLLKGEARGRIIVNMQ